MTSTALVLRDPQPQELTTPRGIPLGRATADYMAYKNKRLTVASQRSYRAALRDLVKRYPAKVISDFEPPIGTALLEDHLTARYGHLAGRTYNRGLSVICDFTRWLHARGELDRDPTLTMERAKQRQIFRTTFTEEQRARIIAANPDPREQIALRLLLDYGLRKGALRNVQLQHFDPDKRRLVIFTKGETIHTLPLPDPELWRNLDLLAGQPEHYLLPKLTTRKRTPPRRKELRRMETLLAETREQLEQAAGDDQCARELGAMLERIDQAHDLLALATDAAETRVTREPAEQCGEHGAHLWWYRCLTRAAIVEAGTTAGKRMHTARHTAGQRVLDKTGNLKAVQALLCHANISTTGDSYTGWETEQLDDTMRSVIPGVAQ